MNRWCVVACLLLAAGANAAASGPDVGPIPHGVSAAVVPRVQVRDGLSPAVDAAAMEEVRANLKRLGLPEDPKEGSGKADAHSLEWPLLLDAGLPGNDRIISVNFVDHDSRSPNQVRDYNCGARTYDTASGYNHRGADLSLWPFAWQSMAQQAVAVVAAAPGTLVLKRDGNFDRNCSFDAPDTPNMVFIQHDDGTVARYLHLKKDSVTERAIGSRIEAGEYLGTVGSSGISTGPHLHFELLSSAQAGATVIDPYAGQCNNVPSRWDEQPAYRTPRLESIAMHDAEPQLFFDSCSTTERPNYQRWFEPGDRVYLAAYYADQSIGDVSTIVLRKPDGTEQVRFPHAPAAGDFGDVNTALASYYYFWFDIPPSAPKGRWEIDVVYKGVTRTTSFFLGEPIFASSGLWFNAAQSGHGFTVEVIESGDTPTLSVAWFTYLDGEPRWIFGVGPIVDGRATLSALISRGGQFPPAFDPSDVTFEPWGELRFSFSGVDRGRVEWTSAVAGFGNGALDLQRAARPSDINLDDVDTGMRACASGSWYEPAQSGHGLQLVVSGDGAQRTLLVAWYVYEDGKQLWLSGAGPIVGNSATVTLNRTTGGQFPPDFDPTQLQQTPWGTATFTLVDPRRMRLQWQGPDGPGALDLQRSTEIVTAACL